MKKTYRESSLFRVAASIAAASILSLSVMASSSIAYDDGWESNGQVYGINFTGDLDFNRMQLSGFAHTPAGISGSSSTSTPFFYLDNGMAKTELPLFTFGDSVAYPGIFYNSGDVQFYSLVLNAAEGDAAATSTITLYAAAAAAAIVAGVVAVDAGAGSGGEESCDSIVNRLCGPVFPGFRANSSSTQCNDLGHQDLPLALIDQGIPDRCMPERS